MSKKKAVIISGYFSPIHVGHLDMIEAAASSGDEVVVIVNNNEQQMLKKGKIIQDENDRLRIVKAIRYVDDAIIAVDKDGTVSETLAVLADRYPDYDLVFANGGDRSSNKVVPETEVCERHGIDMVFDMGGTEKADSSTRINTELGISAETISS